MKKERANSKTATASSLEENARQQIANNINILVADAFALYVKTKNFHWHVTGSHFRDYHLLFDEQAAQIFATIDILAERVRKLGKTTIHSIRQISRLQQIKDNEEEFVEPRRMLQILLDDNKKCAQQLRIVHQVCDDHHDIATASLLEGFIDEAERRIWFLSSTLSSEKIK